MSKINDLKFLSKTKLYIDKTLTLKSLALLEAQKINNLSELISALTGFNVIECIQSHLKLDDLPKQDIIYERLLLCWINNLGHDIAIIQPSEGLVNIFDTFMNKYTINAFFYSLLNKEAEITNYPIMSSIAEAIKNAKNTNDLLRNLALLKRKDTKVIIKIIQKHSGTSINELNPYKLYREATHEYFNSLEKVIGPKDPKITACLNHMKLISEISNIIRGRKPAEALNKLLNKLPTKESAAIRENLEDHFRLDVLLEFSLANYCDDVLSTQVFSENTLLRYLIWKDWETKFIAFLLSSLKLGYGSMYLKEIIDTLVKMYDILTK